MEFFLIVVLQLANLAYLLPFFYKYLNDMLKLNWSFMTEWCRVVEGFKGQSVSYIVFVVGFFLYFTMLKKAEASLVQWAIFILFFAACCKCLGPLEFINDKIMGTFENTHI
ncbi:MAG: hypothetical protein MJ153_09240 [Clostridia bacterium]|nr:hypothetical protein [Clostridia bacterium]